MQRYVLYTLRTNPDRGLLLEEKVYRNTIRILEAVRNGEEALREELESQDLRIGSVESIMELARVHSETKRAQILGDYIMVRMAMHRNPENGIKNSLLRRTFEELSAMVYE
ncbi:MAG TPA: hypothetical protein VJG30_00995 [Candidatus Nanoarchaeia archaeon]|nr:hypothetical protein [Candidatus Nanoarchaeia archaeon]